MAKLSVIITRVQELLGLSAGLSTQTYAQPKIVQYVQLAYADLFIKRFWDDYSSVSTFTLDGTTGKTVEDLTDLIKSVNDIQYIWYQDYNNPLPKAPNNRPLVNINVACFTPYRDVTCPFRIYPLNASDVIHVRYRTKDTLPYSENDEVNMHEELIVRRAAMMYVMNDAANQTLIQLFTSLYNEHLMQLERLEMKDNRSLYSYSSQNVTEWHDA